MAIFFFINGMELRIRNEDVNWERSGRDTRHPQDFSVKRTRLRKSEEVCHAGAAYFNKLPVELKEQTGK